MSLDTSMTTRFPLSIAYHLYQKYVLISYEYSHFYFAEQTNIQVIIALNFQTLLSQKYSEIMKLQIVL